MQQHQKTIYEKCFIGITGIAWVAGLLIAGSDSPYMPWLNGIGLILFLGASILLGKLFNPSHSDAHVGIYPGCYQKPDLKAIRPKKENRKINIPYALGI
ncbi:MAG: hypothetical protein KKE12_06090 [Proteobacteria bacterium]|nr:hypothetical protein [Pseudomonadota bacterium]